MLASSADGCTTLTPIHHGRIPEHAGNPRTGVRRHEVTKRFHACLVVICCLVALQWLHWWTFLIAITMISSLGMRFYLASLHRDMPRSDIASREKLEQ